MLIFWQFAKNKKRGKLFRFLVCNMDGVLFNLLTPGGKI